MLFARNAAIQHFQKLVYSLPERRVNRCSAGVSHLAWVDHLFCEAADFVPSSKRLDRDPR